MSTVLGIPVWGGHYFTDLIGGWVLCLVVYVGVRGLLPERMQRTTPATSFAPAERSIPADT